MRQLPLALILIKFPNNSKGSSVNTRVKAIGVAGGGAGGALAPPWKNYLAWQDRKGSLAGQKWELGRTKMGA